MKPIFFDHTRIQKNPYTRLNLYCPLQPAHCHEFFEFVLVLNGSCRHSLNGQPREELQQGTLLLIRPSDYHEIGFSGKNCTYRDFYVSQQSMQEICRGFGEGFYENFICRRERFMATLSVNELNTLIAKSKHFNNSYTTGCDVRLEQLHRAVITELIGIFIEQSIPRTRNLPDWLNSLYTHLTYFDYVTLSLDDIVKKTGYSHGYVCQMFQKHFNEPLISCHNKYKVIYSCNLLGNMKIIDIASMLGWENPKNYAIQFKRVFGCLPSQYIKQ